MHEEGYAARLLTPHPQLWVIPRATVLDGSGRLRWQHDKRGYFEVRRADIGPPFFPSIPLSELPAAIPEAIAYGKHLHYLDTALGRLSLLVCADILDTRVEGYVPALIKLRPDLVFIVAMTPVTGDFERQILTIRRHGIGVVFVNAGCIAGAKGGGTLGIVDMALPEIASDGPEPAWRKGESDNPKRWRWRWNVGLEFAWKRGDEWRKLDAKSEAAFTIGRNAGVIFDLDLLSVAPGELT